MAKVVDETQEEITIPETTTTTKTKASAVKTFTYDSLRKGSRKLFGITQSTFDGATNDIDQSQKYSVEEIKTHIDEWLKKGDKK